MLKPLEHDTGRNTNFSGKRLDRRLAEIRFSHKLAQPFRPNQRILRECIRILFLSGQLRQDPVVIDKGLCWMNALSPSIRQAHADLRT